MTRYKSTDRCFREQSPFSLHALQTHRTKTLPEISFPVSHTVVCPCNIKEDPSPSYLAESAGAADRVYYKFEVDKEETPLFIVDRWNEEYKALVGGKQAWHVAHTIQMGMEADTLQEKFFAYD